MQYFVSPWFKIWNWLSTILFSAPVCLSIISGAWSSARENFPLRVIIMYFYTICIIFTNINTKIFPELIAEICNNNIWRSEVWKYENVDERKMFYFKTKEFKTYDWADCSIITVKSLLMCHLKFDPDYQDYLGLSESNVLHLLQQPRSFELISFFTTSLVYVPGV